MGTVQFDVENICYRCPDCGLPFTEEEMKKQPGRWNAENPEAIKRGVRSFWSNSFVSPWVSWKAIILKFLYAKENPNDLKTVFNNYLGKLWENRTTDIEEEELMARREDYGETADVPNGALALTCAVDVQKDRLEYEVIGWGYREENWHISYGVIQHPPGSSLAWERLDEVLEHQYRRQDGKALRILFTCVDSGFATDTVYARCYERKQNRVVAIKGDHGEGKDLIPAKKGWRKISYCGRVCYLMFYSLGVDAGKSNILHYKLSIQQPGNDYCHFPLRESAGYGYRYFHGLLSEEYVQEKSASGMKWKWKISAGHERNEPLDLFNYNLAAIRLLNPDFQATEDDFRGNGAGGKKMDGAAQTNPVPTGQESDLNGQYNSIYNSGYEGRW
jgi:phage terminase large subunit GpA-like protein